LLRSVEIPTPVGTAQQEAAIAAVAVLGVKYNVLRIPAKFGLAAWGDDDIGRSRALTAALRLLDLFPKQDHED
jgi:hypothetical protein